MVWLNLTPFSRKSWIAHTLMLRGLTLGLSACLVLSLLGGCAPLPNTSPDAESPAPSVVGSADDAASQQSPALVDPAMAMLQTVNRQFGFTLFSQVSAERSQANIMISPISVSLALALAYNGAASETQTAIAQTLQLPDLNQVLVNQFYSDTLTSLQQQGDGVELAIANSLWSREGLSLKPDFLDRVESSFAAEVNTLNFADPSAPATINAWVNENTQGHIPAIVDQINPEDILFLINAVYFKGDWTQAFDPDLTSDRPFTRLDGTQRDHPLMTQTGRFSYAETEQIQAIQLPYGEDERLRMTVVLPKSGVEWSLFLNQLTAAQWDEWLGQFSSRQGTVRLPKLTLDDQMMLNSALKAMGMAIAFDPNQADFSGLTQEPSVISQVQHRTAMTLSETGTEAAAATSVGISITSVEAPTEPFEMTVDRPFAFVIDDTETQAILFLGTVVDPKI